MSQWLDSIHQFQQLPSQEAAMLLDASHVVSCQTTVTAVKLRTLFRKAFGKTLSSYCLNDESLRRTFDACAALCDQLFRD